MERKREYERVRAGWIQFAGMATPTSWCVRELHGRSLGHISDGVGGPSSEERFIV